MDGFKLVLGVDGGGTRTRTVLARTDGTVVGYGEAEDCNYHNIGATAAAARIREAAVAAFAKAGIPPGQLATAFVGSAGIKAAGDVGALHAAICADGLLPPERLLVANDSENAHAGGLAGRPGVALICGTGSIALGRGRDGRSFLCGGWGWLLDDAASGCWLGQRALRAVARSVDGRAGATKLCETLLQALQITDPHALLERIYVGAFGASDCAALAPLVIAAARDGDATATGILRAGARAAAELVVGAARGAGLSPPCEVVLIGGIARSGPPYQPMIEAAIRRALPGVVLVNPELPPVLGAVLRALEAAGSPCTPKMFARLKRTSFDLISHA